MRYTITTNAKITALWFENSAHRVEMAIADYIKSEGRLLHALVRRGASGWGGGPKVVTGRYLSSIQMRTSARKGEFMVEVGTDEPYGLKLEVGGLVGPGYTNQPINISPHPHFGPAFKIIENGFEREIMRRLAAVLK